MVDQWAARTVTVVLPISLGRLPGVWLSHSVWAWTDSVTVPEMAALFESRPNLTLSRNKKRPANPLCRG